MEAAWLSPTDRRRSSVQRVSPGCLFQEVFWALPTRRRPWGRPGEAGEIVSLGWLGNLTWKNWRRRLRRERDLASLLRLLSPTPKPRSAETNGRMDTHTFLFTVTTLKCVAVFYKGYLDRTMFTSEGSQITVLYYPSIHPETSVNSYNYRRWMHLNTNLPLCHCVINIW